MNIAKKLSGKGQEKWEEKQGCGRKSLPCPVTFGRASGSCAGHVSQANSAADGPVSVQVAETRPRIFSPHYVEIRYLYGFPIANCEGVRKTVICWNTNWKYLSSIQSWSEASQWRACPLPPFTCGRTWSITSLGSNSCGCLTSALHLSLLGLKVSNLH